MANQDLASKWSAHAEALLQWSANVAEKAGNFAAEQTPLLVQEYLAWAFWSSLFYGIAFLVVAVVCGITTYKLVRKAWCESDNEPLFILSVVPCVVCFLCCFGTFDSFVDAAKVKIAPRVIIVEKIAGLAKGVR